LDVSRIPKGLEGRKEPEESERISTLDYRRDYILKTR